MLLSTRRSFERGTPCGLSGRIGLMAAHSSSESSLRIRSSQLGSLKHGAMTDLNTIWNASAQPHVRFQGEAGLHW
jgi:hypothetical protein